MQSVAYRRWDPTQSNLQIEVQAELLQELHPESRGLLHGDRHGSVVRVLAAGEPVSDLEVVGIYEARLRGEVFLTEENLEWFEKTQAPIALVIAGNKGGFFVRETDGSIQSVRSHEEFLLTDGAPPTPPAPVAAKTAVPARRRLWPAAVAVVAVALPSMALTYWRPAPPPPGLRVVEQGGQLRVSWKAGQMGILEVIDGAKRVAFPIAPEQSSVTYDPRSKATAADQLRAQIAALQLESRDLRAAAALNQNRIEGMEKKIAKLTE